MSEAQPDLDKTVFGEELRYQHRSSSYAHRPVVYGRRVRQTINDVTPAAQLSQNRQGIPLVQPAAPVMVELPPAPKVEPVHRQMVASSTTMEPVILRSKLRQVPVGHDSTVVPDAEPSIAKSDTSAKELRRRRFSKQSVVLYTAAAILFSIGSIVSLQGLQANSNIETQVRKLTQAGGSGGSGGQSEGAPPSTKKPTPQAVSNYQVSPNLPRYIDIPSIGVHARTRSCGVYDSGALATPGNVYDTCWYNASAQPGQAGAMLIDGHRSSWTSHGVFYKLNDMKKGDSIIIQRGDGKKFTYTVVKTEFFNHKKVDMSSLLVSQNTAKPGLNLISCAGDVIPGTSEFNQRIAVYAVLK